MLVDENDQLNLPLLVFDQDIIQEHMKDEPVFVNTSQMLAFLLPRYEAEGKTYLSLGIGCTGGRHRSVAIAEEIGRRLAETEAAVSVQHRDLGR